MTLKTALSIDLFLASLALSLGTVGAALPYLHGITPRVPVSSAAATPARSPGCARPTCRPWPTR